jgi:hypothetical protein
MQYKHVAIIPALLIGLYACTSIYFPFERREAQPVTSAEAPQKKEPQKQTSEYKRTYVAEEIAVIAKQNAALETPGGKVLAVAVQMVTDNEYVTGACWDFINTVYNRAGYPREKRVNIFMKPEKGPFADPGLIKPGDWVMYRNLPYGEIGHSALFVEWLDFEERSALTIEYVGRDRMVPGRYRQADLTKTWGVVRGKE